MQHSCSHSNAIRSINSQTRTYLRTEQHQMTTVMQPFQCDLQPEIPQHPITTHTQPHPKQLQATVTLRQKKNDKPTAAATVAHTRYLTSSPAATLHGKTQGFVLRLPPQNIAHATFMQPFQCGSQHQLANSHLSTHRTTPDDNSHAAIPMRSATRDSTTPYNYAHTTTPKAASSHRYTAAKKKRQTDRSRNRRTHEVPYIVACSHFTRKNTRFRAPASSPKHSPCNNHAAIPMRFAASTRKLAPIYAQNNTR